MPHPVPEEPLPENRVVAFVDILGFRSVLSRVFDRGDLPLYGRIRKALRSLSIHAQLTNRPIFPHPEELGPATARATAFSDCIVFSDTLTPLGVESVGAKVALLITWLLRDGILCRGAIAAGPTVHEEDILFGPGLVAAYELESRAAVYPRVILSPGVATMVKSSPLVHVVPDLDGFEFIDPFHGLQVARPLGDLSALFAPPQWDIDQFRAVAQRTALEIQDLARKGDSAAGHLAKWRWVANHLDIAARRFLGVSYQDLLREDR
jgi:hypothetical protein